MSEDRRTARVPWVALALSFLATGVGHIYCGYVGRGLLIFFVWLLLPLTAVVAAGLGPSLAVLDGLVFLPALAIVGLYLLAALDAFRLAWQSPKDYRLRDYNRGAIYVLLVAVGFVLPLGSIWSVREFVFEAFIVPTRSMSPTIRAGDRILVNKLAAHKRFPERGEVIVFRSPGPVARAWVKRVIALPGDTVEVRDGVVLVNDRELARTRVPGETVPELAANDISFEVNDRRRYPIQLLDEPSDKQRQLRDFAKTTVPPRSLFVLGDNRDLSRDSRSFGFVHAGDIIGFAEYVFWPSDHMVRIGTIDRLPTTP